jgi:pimeloyl-ACP methyl ester carboxylesterase
MKLTIYTLLFTSLVLAFTACKKQEVSLSNNADDIFWVSNNGADMPVWVQGNTSSKVIILLIHGGPGEGSYNYNDYETQRLKEKYGLAFWDQRNSGASSGNNNFKQLTFPQMLTDLKAVVKVLKYRYQGASIFLYAHSFGALVAAGYLVDGQNQNDLKAWIEVDGAHNYPLCNSDSKKALIDTGTSEIAKGRNVAKWQEIVNYCKTHNSRKSFNASSQIEVYAHDAESYMGITASTVGTNIFSPEDPFSLLVNYYKLYYTADGDNFIESLQNINYSNQMGKIKIPSLLLWGKYDFTVPPSLGEDAQKHLGSEYKQLIVYPHSGHRPMQGDTDAMEDDIISFVERFK